MEKFRFHNSQWLEMVETQHVGDDAMYGDDIDGDHVFLHDADMLDQPELYYGAQGVQQELMIVMVALCNRADHYIFAL